MKRSLRARVPKTQRKATARGTVAVRRGELVDLLNRLQAMRRLVDVTAECVRFRQGDGSRLGTALHDLEVVSFTLQEACRNLVRLAGVDATLSGMFFDYFGDAAAQADRPTIRIHRRKRV